MSHWLADLRTFLRSAWQGLRASPTTAAVATGTIALCLLLAGSFALLLANMEGMLERFGQEIRISAFLDDGVGVAQQRALLARVRTAPGVEGVELVTKEEALARFRASSSGRGELLEGLDENPLPASLEITLVPEQRNREGMEALAQVLRGLPGVDDLGYGHEWVEGYARAVSLVRGLGLGIGAVLGLATLLIVSNTIRLSVYARRDEIEILLLVGAGRGFVATPFVLEGMAQGLVGGLLALGLLYGFYALFLPNLADALRLLLGYATPVFLSGKAAAWLVAAGVGQGALGSAWALVQSRWDA